MKNTRLEYLFFRYTEKNISPGEREEFMALLLDDKNKDQINLLIEELLRSNETRDEMSHETAEDILSAIFSVGNSQTLVVQADDLNPDLPFSSNRLSSFWIRMVAAATVGVIMFTGGYYFKDKYSRPVSGGALPVKIETLGLPGSNKALLILGNGQSVNLEAVTGGALPGQPEILVDHSKGEVSYLVSKSDRSKNNSDRNTLTTPYGGQYKLVLPDGSKAWLNAGSSIEFPSNFSGLTRNVSIKGEVYFEVTPDKNKPFIVNVIDKLVNNKETKITVLGTHFNVCSYKDSPDIKTTLIEGSVKVNAGKAEKMLYPGQQASVGTDDKKSQISIKQVDSEAVIAWKEGRFEFNGSLKEIMQQISRWYDLDVVFQGNIEDKSFAGAVSRKKNVSDVLKILELTGGVQFETQGRRIIVRNAL